MNDLFTGLYDKYIADTALVAAITGFYNTEAPPKAVFPYIVFQMIINTPDLDSSNNWENYTLQFNIFDNSRSADTIGAIYELLKGDTASGTGFDYFDLIVDNYTTVAMVRQSARLLRVDKIWQYNVLYELLSTYTGEVATAQYCGNFYNLLGIY